MIKLDDLEGQLSVRSINYLKTRGYKYLEQVTPEAVKWAAGKKTKKEILDFIGQKKNNKEVI